MSVTFRTAIDATPPRCACVEVRLDDAEADLVGALLELPGRDAMTGSLGAEELRSRIRRLLWPERRAWLRDVARAHLGSTGGTLLEGALTELDALSGHLLESPGPRARVAYSPSQPRGVDWSGLGRLPDARTKRALVRHGSCRSRYEIPTGGEE